MGDEESTKDEGDEEEEEEESDLSLEDTLKEDRSYNSEMGDEESTRDEGDEEEEEEEESDLSLEDTLKEDMRYNSASPRSIMPSVTHSSIAAWLTTLAGYAAWPGVHAGCLNRIAEEHRARCDASLQCCVAHDAGRVRSMAWCPHRLSEQDQGPPPEGHLPRLGLLALACSNGTVLVFSIPELNSLPSEESRQSSTGSCSSVLVIKPKASLTLELNSRPTHCGPCLSVAWQQGGESRYIAAGFASGMIVLWDLKNSSPLMRRSESILRPLRCSLSHGAPVLSLAWCPQLPNLLASSASDFTVSLTEVDRPGAIHAGSIR
ncbi:hypothetical protein EGW08_004484 [Elysia chlorotica]|uniref:Uncharacterized protein n=1 Tax=Elysia chlorotica TaxID=188477 RepID=A0A3S1BNH2_ELYCH|nr:hypothetical protein EGW08_004484 [Elysia chlorotica]